MLPNVVAITSRFAKALDLEDYDTASRLLADGCIYCMCGAIIIGRDAVIDSYRIHSESAKRRFDSIEYRSDVEATSLQCARICFTDRLCVANESHEFHCCQTVRVGPDGLIDEIRHEELPGERQRLKDFEVRHGSTASSPVKDRSTAQE